MSNKSKKKSNKPEFDDISSLFSTLGSEAEVGYRDFPISEIPGQPAQPASGPAASAQKPSDHHREQGIRAGQQDNRAVFVKHAHVIEANHSPASVVPAKDRTPLRPEELEQEADFPIRSTAAPSPSAPNNAVDEATTVIAEEFFVGAYSSFDEPVTSVADATVVTTDDNKARQSILAQGATEDQWEWYDLIPFEQRAGVLKSRDIVQENSFSLFDAQTDEKSVVSSDFRSSQDEVEFWLLPVDQRDGSKDTSSPSSLITDIAPSIIPPVETRVSSAITEKDSIQSVAGLDQTGFNADANDSHQKVLNTLTNRFRDSFLRGVEKAHTQMQVPDTRFKRVQSKLFESELEQTKQTSGSSKTQTTKGQSRLDDYWLMPSGRRDSVPANKAQTAEEPRQHQPGQSTSSTMNSAQPARSSSSTGSRSQSNRSSSSTAAPAQPAHLPNLKTSSSKPARSAESANQKQSQNKLKYASKSHLSSKKKKSQSRNSKRRPRP